MKYKFNQSKRFQRGEMHYMLASAVFIAFAASILLYAISNLVIISIWKNADITDFTYALFFISIFIILFAALVFIYIKADKGADIKADKIIFRVGYWDKHIPVSFPKTCGEIKFKEIIKVWYMDSYNWNELNKDYKNYNYVWCYIGNKSRDIPVACVMVRGVTYDMVYILPLEQAKDFVAEMGQLI